MREELKVWTDRQRLVAGGELTSAEARSEKLADRLVRVAITIDEDTEGQPANH